MARRGKVDPNEFARRVLLLTDPRYCVMIPHIYLQGLPPEQAILFCYLLNACSRNGIRNNGRWFQLAEEEISKKIGFKQSRQTRALKGLSQQGLIQLKTETGCRWAKVAWNRVSSLTTHLLEEDIRNG